MTSLSIVQKYVCGINSIVTSARRGTYSCQGQKCGEDVHTTASKIISFFPHFWVCLRVLMINTITTYFSKGHICNSCGDISVRTVLEHWHYPRAIVKCISEWLFLPNKSTSAGRSWWCLQGSVQASRPLLAPCGLPPRWCAWLSLPLTHRQKMSLLIWWFTAIKCTVGPSLTM